MVLVKRPCVYTYRSLDFFSVVDVHDAEGPQRGAHCSWKKTNTCVCLVQKHASADTDDR